MVKIDCPALRPARRSGRIRTLDAVRAALTDHVRPDGVRLSAAIRVITASNPT
jgi:hypothetical protein